MLKAFKTEINPSPEQKDKIIRTMGTCRFVHNLYIAENKAAYEAGRPFLSGMSFSVWLNNSYIPSNPDKAWIKDVSSKSVKKAIMDAETAFKRFFQGKAGYPRFRKKNRNDVTMYFVRNRPNDCECQRHRVKIPTLGWVRLKEKGYIPVTQQGYRIRSGTISQRAGRFYLSVLIDVPEPEKQILSGTGIGIDLGIKNLAILSDGTVVPNINKTARMRQLKKQLKRAQRSLSRKYENLKKSKKKGEPAQRSNIRKQVLKVQEIQKRMDNIRTDHINKAIHGIVKTKPSYVVLEDLNVSGMMKNRCLSESIAQQKLSEFRQKLTVKCKVSGTEVRIANRWYPSSKTCHTCGYINHGLKLSDRTYICPVCGMVEDRDLNAARNLCDMTDYKVA